MNVSRMLDLTIPECLTVGAGAVPAARGQSRRSRYHRLHRRPARFTTASAAAAAPRAAGNGECDHRLPFEAVIGGAAPWRGFAGWRCTDARGNNTFPRVACFTSSGNVECAGMRPVLLPAGRVQVPGEGLMAGCGRPPLSTSRTPAAFHLPNEGGVEMKCSRPHCSSCY